MRRLSTRGSEQGDAADGKATGAISSALTQPPLASLDERRALIQVARGKQPADIVFRNGQVVNVFTAEIYPAEVAVYREHIAGIAPYGTYSAAHEVDVKGAYLTPGLVEAHTHIEHAYVTPREYARALAIH